MLVPLRQELTKDGKEDDKDGTNVKRKRKKQTMNKEGHKCVLDR
jgi:hypothetical protein